MHNPTSKGECEFHQGVIPTSWSCDQGPVYGFVDDKIVVAGGCSGVFTVCYTGILVYFTLKQSYKGTFSNSFFQNKRR